MHNWPPVLKFWLFNGILVVVTTSLYVFLYPLVPDWLIIISVFIGVGLNPWRKIRHLDAD